MDHEPLSSRKIVALVLNVHRNSRLGMPEGVYQCSFEQELVEDHIRHKRLVKMPIGGKRCKAMPDYRADLLINGKMVVELKGIATDR